MMSIQPIKQILLDIAPEMQDLDNDLVERLIKYSQIQIAFGDEGVKRLATAYLTAHKYTISNKIGNAGNIASEKEGDLQRSFGGVSIQTGLEATSYGLELMRLARMFILKPQIRSC